MMGQRVCWPKMGLGVSGTKEPGRVISVILLMPRPKTFARCRPLMNTGNLEGLHLQHLHCNAPVVSSQRTRDNRTEDVFDWLLPLSGHFLQTQTPFSTPVHSCDSMRREIVETLRKEDSSSPRYVSASHMAEQKDRSTAATLQREALIEDGNYIRFTSKVGIRRKRQVQPFPFRPDLIAEVDLVGAHRSLTKSRNLQDVMLGGHGKIRVREMSTYRTVKTEAGRSFQVSAHSIKVLLSQRIGA